MLLDKSNMLTSKNVREIEYLAPGRRSDDSKPCEHACRIYWNPVPFRVVGEPLAEVSTELEEYAVTLMSAALHGVRAGAKPDRVTWEQVYRLADRHSTVANRPPCAGVAVPTV